MIEFFKYLHHLDKDITLAINSIHCPASDWIWGVFSDKEIWFAMYAVIAFFIIRNLGWKRGLISIAAIVLTIVCCDQLGNVSKAFFQRLRPCCDGEMIARGHRLLEWCGPIEYGFYSAHAANAIGLAVSSYRLFRNDRSRNYSVYGICIFCWGLLVGFSRIFVGKHFFGDVMVGFAVGILLGWVISSVATLIVSKFPPQDSPSVEKKAE